MQIVLPVSQWNVEIRESITFEEFQELDNFVQNRIKLDVDVKTGNQTTIVPGSIVQEMQDKMIQTYLRSCRGTNNEEISIVGLIKRLDAEDGMFLKNHIADKHEELKKKLLPTKSE